jgi:putative oxidoreductase
MLMGVIFSLHAGARLYEASIDDFGVFLGSNGFPAGNFFAWFVTIFELVGGIAMFLRYGVKIFCAIEIIILLTGIFLVHWPNGWFTVGAQKGGIEFSIVLITVLASIFIAERISDRNIKPVL